MSMPRGPVHTSRADAEVEAIFSQLGVSTNGSLRLEDIRQGLRRGLFTQDSPKPKLAEGIFSQLGKSRSDKLRLEDVQAGLRRGLFDTCGAGKIAVTPSSPKPTKDWNYACGGAEDPSPQLEHGPQLNILLEHSSPSCDSVETGDQSSPDLRGEVKIKTGVTVRVLQEFAPSFFCPRLLNKGDVGVVKQIDEAGDAMVDFDNSVLLKVTRRDFQKLQVENRSIREGDVVKVREDFKPASQKSLLLQKGEIGHIIQITEAGIALIKFSKHPDYLNIRKEEFSKLMASGLTIKLLIRMQALFRGWRVSGELRRDWLKGREDLRLHIIDRVKKVREAAERERWRPSNELEPLMVPAKSTYSEEKGCFVAPRASRGHTRSITCAAVFPGGEQVVTGSEDLTVIVWSTSTRERLQELVDDDIESPILCLAVLPVKEGEGPLKGIVIAGSDRAASMWDASGALLRRLPHDWRVCGIACFPAGDKFITACEDVEAAVWSADGQKLNTLADSTVRCVALFPHGFHAITAGDRSGAMKVWRTGDSEMKKRIPGRSARVSHMAVFPNGQQVITGSVDFTAIIWTVRTWQPRQQLLGHGGELTGLSVLPGGCKIITVSQDKAIRVWNLFTGYKCHQMNGHKRNVNTVAVFPEGSQVITAGDDKATMIWKIGVDGILLPKMRRRVLNELQIAELNWSREVREGGHFAFGFGASDDTLLLMRSEKTAIVRNASTGQEWYLEGTSKVLCAAQLQNNRVITGEYGGDAYVWDTRHPAKSLHMLRGHEDAIICVAVSPTGSEAVTGSRDNLAIVWDCDNGTLLHKLEGHRKEVQGVAVFPNYGNKFQVITGSPDSTVKFWRATSGDDFADPTNAVYGATVRFYDKSVQVQTLQDTSRILCVATLPSRWQAVACGAGGIASIWDCRTATKVHQLIGHKGDIWSVAVFPSDLEIITGSRDNIVIVWNAITGFVKHSIRGSTQETIYHVALSPSGRQVISSNAERPSSSAIKLWQARFRELPHSPEHVQHRFLLGANARSILTLDVVPSSDHFITGDDEGKVCVWRLSDGGLVKEVQVPVRPDCDASGDGHGLIHCVRACPNSKDFVVAVGNIASVWNVSTLAVKTSFEGHTGIVTCVSVFPDGDRVVTGSADQTAKVWDTTTGNASTTFSEHRCRVNCVAVLPSGDMVVTGDEGGIARVWSSSGGQQLHELLGHSWVISCVAAFPQNERQFMVGEDVERLVRASEPDKVGRWEPRKICEISSAGVCKLCWLKTETQEVSPTAPRFEWQQEAEVSITSKAGIQIRQKERVITGSFDKTAIIWNANTGEKLKHLRGHLGEVSSIVVFPGGDKVMTASWDHTAIIWNSNTGLGLLQFEEHNEQDKFESLSQINCAALLPKRRFGAAAGEHDRLITAGEHGVAIIWEPSS